MSVLAHARRCVRFYGLGLLLVLVGCAEWLAPIVDRSGPCLSDADCTLPMFCLGDGESRRCRRSVAPRCGDGQTQDSEACDDGNRDDQDACRNDCQRATCGDGLLRHDLAEDAQGYEACDDGNLVDGDGCTNRCLWARCGDGVRRLGLDAQGRAFETCDDGNAEVGDGCNSDCQVERCGNGLLDPGEACDDGNVSDADACRNTCTVARCGDGVVRADLPLEDEAYEACDDGNAIDTDACTSDCAAARCGDARQRTGLLPGSVGYEACDDGNERSGDGCSSACQLETCGDAQIDLGEACDDGNELDADACRNDCTLGVCGDGVRRIDSIPGQPVPEACDDGNDVDDDLCTNACRYQVDLVPLPQVRGQTYLLGSPLGENYREDDERQHQVQLTHRFAIGRTEVTQGLYEAIMGYNPSLMNRSPDSDFSNGYGDTHPVSVVGWPEMVSFLNRLSVANGHTACYAIDGSDVTWPEGLACDGYRLPTEAEWEIAARAGTETLYAGGDDADAVAWWGIPTPYGVAQPVASKAPNAWGLYDMSGNLFEWVWDWYGPYPEGPLIDPTGPAEGQECYRNSGPCRVSRGGFYGAFNNIDEIQYLRVASRYPVAPRVATSRYGFRIAQTLP